MLDKLEGRVQAPADVPTRVDSLWRAVASQFILDHPHLKLPGGEKGRQLYFWGTAAVASYSFILGDDHYQV